MSVARGLVLASLIPYAKVALPEGTVGGFRACGGVVFYRSGSELSSRSTGFVQSNCFVQNCRISKY